jgi:hypothetical protein
MIFHAAVNISGSLKVFIRLREDARLSLSDDYSTRKYFTTLPGISDADFTLKFLGQGFVQPFVAIVVNEDNKEYL